jgi:citrate lyase beta subunit
LYASRLLSLQVQESHFPVINGVFTPDAETIDAARRVKAMGEESSRNIAVSNGMMLGTPFFQAAQQLLDEFDSDSQQ